MRRHPEELTSLEQRTSNLPVEQVEIRAQLCADLGLTPDDLPYAGELLDMPTSTATGGARQSGCCVGLRCRSWCPSSTTTPWPMGERPPTHFPGSRWR